MLLAFQETVTRSQRRRDPAGRLLPLAREEWLRRDKLFHELKRLNPRDPAVRIRLPGRGVPEEGARTVAASYLAGFIDGEGSLLITKSKSRRHGWTQCHARIAVTNTDERVLKDLQGTFGGILVSLGLKKAHWNPGCVLVWSDGMVEHVLATVGPHLWMKQRQAYILAEFVRHKHATVQGRTRRGFAPFPAEVVAYREGCHAEMARLNARGVSSSPSRPGPRTQ